MAEAPQMFDHFLDPKLGYPGPTALVKRVLAASADDEIVRGSVCSLDANGDCVAGVDEGALHGFAFNGSTDFDAIGDDGNVIGNLSGRGIGNIENLSLNEAAKPQMLLFLCTGGFELETTEFDPDGSYPANTFLSGDASGGADSGLIRPATMVYAEDVVGQVTDGEFNNHNAKAVVRFVTMHLPAIPASVLA